MKEQDKKHPTTLAFSISPMDYITTGKFQPSTFFLIGGKQPHSKREHPIKILKLHNHPWLLPENITLAVEWGWKIDSCYGRQEKKMSANQICPMMI